MVGNKSKEIGMYGFVSVLEILTIQLYSLYLSCSFWPRLLLCPKVLGQPNCLLGREDISLHMKKVYDKFRPLFQLYVPASLYVQTRRMVHNIINYIPVFIIGLYITC